MPDGSISSAYVREAFRMAEEERPGERPAPHVLPRPSGMPLDTLMRKAGSPSRCAKPSYMPPPLRRRCPHRAAGGHRRPDGAPLSYSIQVLYNETYQKLVMTGFGCCRCQKRTL